MLTPQAPRRRTLRTPRRFARRAGVVVAALSLVTAEVVSPVSAQATVPSCSTAGISVTPSYGPVFYIDPSNSPALTSAYAGYQVKNTTGSAMSDTWVQLSAFTGGAVALGSGQPAAEQIPTLADSASKTLFWYLTAANASSAAQNHTVTVYSHKPGLANATVLCSTSGGFSSVATTIGANANKITSIALSSATPSIGATFAITVNGNTGTIGQGPPAPDADPQSLWMSPSATSGWPAAAYRLIGTQLSISPDGTAAAQNKPDVLHVTNLGSAARDYTATYTFQATGFTSSNSTLVPVEQISSGTQIKHTGSYPATIPAIAPATNDLAVSVSADPARLPSSGGTVGYTATLTGSTGASLDSLTLTVPAGATVVPGSVAYDGVTVPDPVSDGAGDLVVQGPFTLTSGTDTVTFDMGHDAGSGAKQTSVIGTVGAATIDTTPNDLTDVSPATTSVQLNTVPVAAADSATVAVDSGPTTIPVLANDTDADGDALSVTSVTQPAHGTTTLTGSTVRYTPDSAYTGQDSFNYTISDGNGGTATATATITVAEGLSSQTITFVQPDDATMISTVQLSAGTDSGLPVSFQSLTSSVCGVDAGTGAVILLATGICTIQADQSGDESYAAATPVPRSFLVTKAPQTTSFGQPDDVSLDAAGVTVSATSDSGLSVAFTATTPAVCTVTSSGAVTLLTEGTCTIEADQPGDVQYSAADPVVRSFTVSAAIAAQTLTFPQIPDTALLDSPVTAGATADSGLPVGYDSQTPQTCAVNSTGEITLLAIGTCTIEAYQEGDATHSAAEPVTRSFAVVRSPQHITFPALSDVPLLAGTATAQATATSGLPVTYASATPSVCSVGQTGVVTLLAIGTCTITATQDGSETYDPAEPATRSFEVGLTPQTITVTAPATEDVSVGSVTIGASSDSGLPVTITAGPAAVCAMSAARTLQLLASGQCHLHATAAGDVHYADAEPVDATVAVTAQTEDHTYTLPPATGSAPPTTWVNVLGGASGETLVNVTQPAHGHVVIDGSRVAITLPTGYKGTETFTYTAEDRSGALHTATVTIVVPNSPPTISDARGTTLAGVGRRLTVRVADPNHDALKITVGPHPGAKVVVHGDEVGVVPSLSDSGRLTVQLTVSDGDGGVAHGTISLLVRPRPTPSATRRLIPSGTHIAWRVVKTAGAQYVVTIDGHRACVTTALACDVARPLGARADVLVTVRGHDRTVSSATPARPRHGAAVLAGIVYFATAKATLSSTQQHRVQAISRRLVKDGFASLSLVGYTDDRGSHAYNRALSRRRARRVASIVRTLTHMRVGVRLAWRGEGDPAATNTTSHGEALNRRVEIWVS